MNKINYYKESLKEIEHIKTLDKKPTLLFHVCCAVCSAYPLSFLNDIFDITIYYNNSNIYPVEEYNRRLNELRIHLDKYYPNIKLLVPTYDNLEYNKLLDKYGAKKEGESRCFACYYRRMSEAYKYAIDNNYDYMTTVMSVSRQKDSNKLNQLGRILEIQNDKKVKYFYSDFKKNDGNKKTNIIANENGMYRQDYCGCIYSYNERNKR